MLQVFPCGKHFSTKFGCVEHKKCTIKKIDLTAVSYRESFFFRRTPCYAMAGTTYRNLASLWLNLGSEIQVMRLRDINALFTMSDSKSLRVGNLRDPVEGCL